MSEISLSNNVTKNDIMYLQNEMLSDIKKFENKITSKLDNESLKNNENLEKISLQIETIQNKLFELQSNFTESSINKEKLENLLILKEKVNNIDFIFNNKISNLEKELSQTTFRFEKEIINNLKVPGLIGDGGKFSNLKEFINFSNKLQGEFKSFRDKSLIDTKIYKEKLENTINKFNLQIDNIKISFSDLTNKKVKTLEENILNRFLITDEKVQNLRIENNKYSNELIESSKNIKNEWEKMIEFKENYENKYENDIKNFNSKLDEYYKAIEIDRSEFKLMKQKFTQLSEFIKDVRFKKNIGSDEPISKFKKFSKKINFNKKQIYNEEEENNNILNEDIKNLIDDNNNDNNIDNNIDNNNNNENNENEIKQKNSIKKINLIYKLIILKLVFLI